MELVSPAEDVQGGNPSIARKGAVGEPRCDQARNWDHQEQDVGDIAAKEQQEDEQAPMALDVQCNKIRGRMCLQSFQVGAIQRSCSACYFSSVDRFLRQALNHKRMMCFCR